MQPELLTVSEVRLVTGLSEKRIYDLLRRGIRIGRQRRVSRRALEAFIEQGGVGLNESPHMPPKPEGP